MDVLTLVLFVIGIVLLIVGAELLVRGASNLALAIGISPLVVGLTVVSFGTSAPELAVSIQGAFAGQKEVDVALGNVIGSNIMNILFVLGLSALIAPLAISMQLIRMDVPLMIGISFIMWLMALNGRVDRIDGFILAVGIVGYVAWTIYKSRQEQQDSQTADSTEEEQNARANKGFVTIVQNVIFVVIGLVFLVTGANWLLNGAVTIAEYLGISSLIIGLTIVAVGTSLPEVATSVIGVLRGERDIVVGNVIGSNIFNILAVLGFASLLAPNGITVPENALRFDIPIMVAVALVCFPVFFTGYMMRRWEGFLFICYYMLYTTFLVLQAIKSPMLEPFSSVMIYLVLPLTVILLVALTLSQVYKLRRNRAQRNV
ncbi:MAG: calcium/sodium antiporter [Chloroflexaceae bacterium]|nr:calcium/sodium antiporter [Chloroflexaceae bacterium]